MLQIPPSYRELETEIWLIFGAFVYGLEGTLQACSQSCCDLKVTPNQAQGVLSTILKNRLGLLHVEIRFFDDTLNRPQFPIHLFAEKWLSCDSENGLFRFQDLKGISPNDDKNWHTLFSEVSKAIG